MTKSFTAVVCLAGLLALSAAPACAAVITVDDTAAYNQTSGGTIFTLDSTDLTGFDPSGSDKLVVTISNEKQGGGTASITGVTYDGFVLTEAQQFFSSVSNQLTGIFFLDNPSTSGDLTINFSSNMNGIGVSVLALSGTAPGVSVTNGNDGQSTSLTTLVDDSFVVASHVNNGNSGTAQPPLTPLLDAPVGSAGGGSGYQQVPVAGLVSPTFTGSTVRPVTVAAAFAPEETAPIIPEPASASLFVLALGAFIRRRR